jgi:hypothetical protein
MTVWGKHIFVCLLFGMYSLLVLSINQMETEKEKLSMALNTGVI